MAFHLLTGPIPNVDTNTTNYRNAESEKLEPDIKSGNVLSFCKTGGGGCEVPQSGPWMLTPLSKVAKNLMYGWKCSAASSNAL